jgi:hypothetical protein
LKPYYNAFLDVGKQDIAFVNYDNGTNRYYYGCLDSKGVYHGDFVGQGSPSNIIGKVQERSMLMKNAPWNKTST